MHRLALGCCGLAAIAPAQAIIPVTSTVIDPFVQAASPGDILLLQGGTHTLGIQIVKGITLVGPAQLSFASGGGGINLAVPATQRARFVDITFGASIIGASGQPGITVQAIDSNVTFERCACDGTSMWGGLWIDGGNVLIDRCTFTLVAASAANANVQILSSSFSGREVRAMLMPFGTHWVPNSPGFSTQNGTLQASDSTFTAGPGNPALGSTYFGKPGLEVINHTAWITDSTITGSGAGTNPGAPALFGGTCFHARTALIGGPGNPPGPPSAGIVLPQPLLLGAHETPSLILGAPYAMNVTADQPGVPIVIGMSTEALPATPLPGVFVQPLWLAGNVDIVAAGVTGAGSQFTLAFTVPSAPALQYAFATFTGARVGSLPLQLSPLCGGVIR